MTGRRAGGRHAHTLELVLHLVRREFRLRYQRSALGWLWSVGNPLARLLILSFIFTTVLPLDVPDYPVFLFIGLIGWTWFSSGVISATASAVARRELLFRPGVSRTVVPLVSVLSDGINYLAALPVLALFLLLTTGIPVTALLLPVVLLPMVALTLGLGLVLCVANVYVRDVWIVVELVMLLGFYVTPVFYAPANVPGAQSWLLTVNPMAWALDSQRRVLLEGRLPQAESFLALVVVAAIALLVGTAVYRRASASFVDEL